MNVVMRHLMKKKGINSVDDEMLISSVKVVHTYLTPKPE